MRKRPEELRRELEHMIIPFEAAKRRAVGINGWLRAVRRAQDLSAKEVADQLWVRKREIMRIEVAEMNGTANLMKMRCVAAVMECDLVYAFVPKGTTFEEIAERERKSRECAEEQKCLEKVSVDDRNALDRLADAIRKEFRRLGVEWVEGSS